MQVCIYTTNRSFYLEGMFLFRRSPEDYACFHSAKKWAAAKYYLDRSGTLPILIREDHKDDTNELACTFLADLVDIWFAFPKDVETSEAREAWLKEKLWLQREVIKHDPDPRFGGWKDQLDAWEISHALKAKTNYCIRNLRKIEPLPLPKLMKRDGGEPLSEKFIYSYSICWYPESEVHIVDVAGKVDHSSRLSN